MNKELGLPTLLDTDLSKDDGRKIIKDSAEEIAEHIELVRACKSHGILIILQGMDASGKDGALRNLFAEASPANLRVKAFKTPTEEEMAHDFLWRIHKEVPKCGEVVIFNRSHYEDILIQRVHKWIDMKQVENRMRSINEFERLLVEDRNTVIMKFFLNISFEQQEIELQQRLDEYDKHWKHNPGDWKERKFWSEYMDAYKYILDNSIIPWYITPVDKRYHRDLFMSEKILEVMKALNLSYPTLEEVLKNE